MTELERLKRDIDLLMVEYEKDISAALKWYRDWRSLNGGRTVGFRCLRGQPASPASPKDDDVLPWGS